MIETSARAAADRFLEISQCGKPSCKCARAARLGHGLTHCPLHRDNTPSFNVTVKGDKLLVCCEAGCAQAEVVSQMKEVDLWPHKAEYGKQIVAEYDYRDADGSLLYQALRYFPKDFKQRRPKGTDQWDWSLGDVPRVLYRLPELLASGQRRVFIVEGEKDVDRLMAAGFVATCNVGGAGKWRDEYSAYLKGRQVIIAPDNDESGRQHGHQVARSLERIASSVRWLDLPDLPEKGDVSDWFDLGGTAEQLRELATAAGSTPSAGKRDRVFQREGLGYRYEPIEAPIIARLGRIADRRDETTAELHITGADGRFVLRRRINLLAASGTTFNGLVEDLKDAELGLDVDWKRVLRDGFETVLEAHRNGLIIETVAGEIETPPPVEWFCDGLLLRNKINCWLGSGGTGKSTLAKALCTCYAARRPFLGREFSRNQAPGSALYLDWEDDRSDLERVAYEVCRGMDVWPVPKIHWLNMRGRRLRDHIETLGRKIAELHVQVCVLDAIAAAGGAPGEHMSWEAVALELEQCLGQLPPVTILGLDHVTADDHRNTLSVVPVKARGAERKYEFVRNQWTLMLDRTKLASSQHVVTWYHTKINSALPRPEFTTEIVHGPGTLTFREASIEASPEAIERLPLSKQNVLEVRRQPGQTVREICIAVRNEDSKSKVDATRIDLNRESRRGEVWEQDGKWYPSGYPGASKDLPWTPYKED